LVCRPELTGLELLGHLPNCADTADDHADAGGGQGLMGIRAAIAGQNVLHATVCHEPGRLNSGALAEFQAGVVNSLEAQVVGLDDQEIRAAAEARIDRSIQGGLSSRDC
jgi:hypothetical protein